MGWQSKTHGELLSSPKRMSRLRLPSGMAVIRTQLCSLHLQLCVPAGWCHCWTGTCHEVAPRAAGFHLPSLVPSGATPSASPPAKVSRLLLIGLLWVTCPSLNQSLAQGMQESDWPGLDHMTTSGARRGSMVPGKYLLSLQQWKMGVGSGTQVGPQTGVSLL